LDMLLGADFFLSHRIYVANSQNRVYFTYNGGPVFNLNAPKTAAAEPPDTPSSDANDDGDSGDGAKGDGTKGDAVASDASAPSDAAGFLRRGSAFAARHDFERALADFDKACALSPTEPSCYYQRARVRYSLQRPEQAAADIEQALKLKPDYVDAL